MRGSPTLASRDLFTFALTLWRHVADAENPNGENPEMEKILK